jgi:lysyl-tRNA synthetase class 2
LNPHTATVVECAQLATKQGIQIADLGPDIDLWLDLLMSEVVTPQLGRDGPVFITDFPASQSALARLKPGTPVVAARFELFLAGMELANGFHELTDAAEQRRRFVADNTKRRAQGQPEMPMDERFLAALAAGLPDCAGVALGVDRLLMALLGQPCIDGVLSFPIEIS